MRCPQPADCPSDDGDRSDIGSCFDSDNNSTELDTDFEEDDEADFPLLLDEDEDSPLEYYHNEEDEGYRFYFPYR
jgi:hypothetical protein